MDLHNPLFLSSVSLARFKCGSALAFSTSSLHDQIVTFAELPTHSVPSMELTSKVGAGCSRTCPAEILQPVPVLTDLTMKTFLCTSKKSLVPSSLAPFQQSKTPLAYTESALQPVFLCYMLQVHKHGSAAPLDSFEVVEVSLILKYPNWSIITG